MVDLAEPPQQVQRRSTRRKNVANPKHHNFRNNPILTRALAGEIFTDGIVRNVQYIVPWEFIGVKPDVKKLNINPFGKVVNNVLRRYYIPYVNFMCEFAPMNPTMKARFEVIRKADLMSSEYMEPAIDKMDVVLTKHLRSFVSLNDKGEDTTKHYAEFKKGWEKIRAELMAMPVTKGKSLRSARLKSMVDYMDLISKRAKTLKNGTQSGKVSASEYNDARMQLEEFLRDAKMRQTGERIVFDETRRKAINQEKAGKEYMDGLKRRFDVRYINPHPRRIPFQETDRAVDNAENYFLKTATYGFDDDGKPVKTDDKSPVTVDEFAQRLANMYLSGREHDALRALEILQLNEGAQSKELFPSGFQKELAAKLQGAFEAKGINSPYSDPHFSYFNERIDMILNGREHSPYPDDPRDVLSRIAQDLTGTLLPGFIDRNFIKPFLANPMGMSDVEGGFRYASAGRFFATPLVADFAVKPLARVKNRCLAYFNGGYVSELSEDEAKSSKLLLDRLSSTKIEKNRWFFMRPTVPDDDPMAKYNSWADRAPMIIPLPIFNFTTLARLTRDTYKTSKALVWNKYTRRGAVLAAGTAVVTLTPIGPAIGAAALASAGTTAGMSVIGVSSTALLSYVGIKGYRLGSDLRSGYKAVKQGINYGCTYDKNGKLSLKNGKVHTLEDAYKDKTNDLVSDAETLPEPVTDKEAEAAPSPSTDLDPSVTVTESATPVPGSNAELIAVMREFIEAVKTSSVHNTAPAAGSPVNSQTQSPTQSQFTTVAVADSNTAIPTSTLDDIADLGHNVVDLFGSVSTNDLNFSVDTTQISDQKQAGSGSQSSETDGPAMPGLDQ